jgi:hypothetical protein
MDEEQAKQIYLDDLPSMAEFDRVTDPPEVEFVRWTSRTDLGPTMEACLREQGFESAGSGSTLDFPGDLPASQYDAQNRAMYICHAKYPLHPSAYGIWSGDERMGLLYDYLVEWYVPCVAQLGITVSEPPTKESWLASVNSGAGGEWYPPNEAGDLYGSTYEKTVRLARTCPKEPPVSLWGEEG